MRESDWLTVDVVEDLHHAVNQRVEPARLRARIGGISKITMPALLEYWCLRTSVGQLPILPQAIRDGALGRNLLRVLSPNHAKQQALDMKPRQCEFIAFATKEDMVGDPVEFYQMRFWKSAQEVGFSKKVSNCLHAGLNEIMTNAVQHSRSTRQHVAGYAVQPNIAQFAVVDLGQGVLARLRQSAKYADLTSHSDAIRLALHDGITSDPSEHGGYGFRDIFNALAVQWGYLRFRSGEGCVIMDGTALDAEAGSTISVAARPGFQVNVTCRATAAAPAEPIC